MRMNLKPLVPAILVALSTVPAYAVDFTGYVRAGTGISANGGGVESGDEFNKTTLGRLGNEFDTYSEIGLGQELYKQEDKTIYFQSMFSFSSDGELDSESTSDGNADVGLKQLNLQAKGFIPSAPEATLWAGKRFYQRHDLHIIDSKYWNISGYGFGLEGLKAGPGALSTAIIRGDQSGYKLTGTSTTVSDGVNVNYLDVRYAGYQPWSGAWTEVGVDYAMLNTTDSQDAADFVADNGVMLTAEISQSFSKGYNKTVFQYGNKGLAQNMISQNGGWYDTWSGDISDAQGFRVINTGDFNVSDNIMFNHVITYGYAQDHGDWVDDQTLLSVVVRPQYTWSEHNKTVFELGYFSNTKTWDGGSEDKSAGEKFTVAQVLSAGKYIMARPELRLYATYVKDNESESFNDSTEDNDIRVGVQVEAWW
ncbi:maltoporin [Vibrio xiamenensis]|uniref:Maltoporin n=1 Tax=Vibrio xiamenensis TaxID=861298 RepID=A0A1G7XLV1_9VIBR|nr:maltoporin [Vibrio xiamenensis]SDG85056.1 maltoporin [Vibrio xiamenensis]